MSAEDEVALSVRCPICGVEPGERCRKTVLPDEFRSAPHLTRVQQAKAAAAVPEGSADA